MAIFELPGSLTQLLLGEQDHLRKGLPAQAATGLRLRFVIKEFFQIPKWDHFAKVLLASKLFPLSQSVKSVTVNEDKLAVALFCISAASQKCFPIRICPFQCIYINTSPLIS